MSLYVPFQQQKKQDAELTLKAMGIQLGINIGISLVVVSGFCFLRPRHSLVYAPKAKFSSPEQRPPPIGSGWFAWVKPVITTKDDFLMDRIGLDAVMFLRFLRLLRRLLLIMSIIGICGLVPINIVATYRTGDWPPAPGLDLLSMSGINYHSLDPDKPTDMRWFWSPATATWLFSILIGWFMYRASCDYIDIRQHYFRHPSNALSARSLLVSRVPKESQSDSGLQSLIESRHFVRHPIDQAMIGRHSDKLTKLTEEHDAAVKNLEDTLSSYLNDGKKMDKKRPTIRVGGFLGCGGRKKDAIDYYTEQVNELKAEIEKLRSSTTKPSNFGWVAFKETAWAHEAKQGFDAIGKKSKLPFGVRLSPEPKDIIWANLPLDEKVRSTKRWIGRGLFWAIIFAWAIPVTALSATSNVANLIRLFPGSETFIENNSVLVGIIQAWFTPIVMALFFFVLPYIFRFLSTQQGYVSHTTVERKVLTKLYIFFIINNLLVFTLASMLIGIYGQIRSLILSGTVSEDQSIADNIIQLAKNISDVSTFWINYVSVKALGITMEMAQLLPLVIITIRKWITRPSPRQLKEVAQPPEFDYPHHYNLLLFFFTIALIYSAIAPLVLPFALLYFTISSIVYKYLLMYICVTKSESGGRIWPTLFQTIMISVILFQIIMIIILNLKGGHVQSYMLIPLPFLTLAYQFFYYRRMKRLGSYLIGSWDSSKMSGLLEEAHPKPAKPAKPAKKTKQDLSQQFEDPAIKSKLLQPMVHDDVKHLLPQVYKDKTQRGHDPFHEGIEMVQHAATTVRHKMDLDQRHGFENNKRMTVLHMEDGHALAFQTMTEAEVEATDDSDSERDESYGKEEVAFQRGHAPLPNQSSHVIMNDYDSDRSSQDGLVSHNHMEHHWHQQRSFVDIPQTDRMLSEQEPLIAEHQVQHVTEQDPRFANTNDSWMGGMPATYHDHHDNDTRLPIFMVGGVSSHTEEQRTQYTTRQRVRSNSFPDALLGSEAIVTDRRRSSMPPLDYLDRAALTRTTTAEEDMLHVSQRRNSEPSLIVPPSDLPVRRSRTTVQRNNVRRSVPTTSFIALDEPAGEREQPLTDNAIFTTAGVSDQDRQSRSSLHAYTRQEYSTNASSQTHSEYLFANHDNYNDGRGDRLSQRQGSHTSIFDLYYNNDLNDRRM